MTTVKPHRRDGGRTFVRAYSRGPIETRLSLNDPAGMPPGFYAYVDPYQPDVIYIDRFDPALAGRRGEREEKTVTRLLSHETLHASLGRLGEEAASRRLDSEISMSGASFAPFTKVISTGLMRKKPKRGARGR